MTSGKRVNMFGIGVFVLLVGVNFFVWSANVGASSSAQLSVTFLNVGQGDAIFIESPTGVQVLIDGGPSRGVLRELGELMRWNDRTIDMVIATHPDADHIGGLPSVLERYDVARIVRSGVRDDGASDYEAFNRAIEAEVGAEQLVAQRGQLYDLGGGTYIEVLFPDRPVPDVEANLGSIVLRLVYGDTSFLLTGDSPSSVEMYLAGLDAHDLASTVLKAGHHGSDTSTSAAFLGFVSPKYVVFSRGCDNRYGHPHPDVVRTVEQSGAQIKDTCIDGSTTFTSNGLTLRWQ